MKQFTWSGSKEQQECHGIITAPNYDIALCLLTEQAITVKQLKALKKIRYKHTHRLYFLQELKQLLQSGISIKDAINLLPTSQPDFFALCQTLQKKLDAGEQFAHALSSCHFLTAAQCTLLGIGERSAALVAVITAIIKNLEQKRSLKQQIKKTLFYPCFLLALTIIIMLLMLIFIVPRFAKMYAQLSAPLPWVTKIMLNTSLFLTQQPLWLMLTIFFIAISTILLKRYSKQFMANLLFKLPLFRESWLAEFFALVHICLQSGLSLRQSLQLCQSCYSIKPAQMALDLLIARIEQGLNLKQACEQVIFPAQVQQRLQLAEQCGQVTQAFLDLSVYYSNKIKQRSEQISLFIEPLIMLVLGLCIGSIVIAMYLPMFQLGMAL